ncbi:hypothetical protein Q7P37_003044 [Cladosporium fusiforme]
MPRASFIQRITVKHPGYGGNNTILALPACDGASAPGKAHYATVHSACTIVANNRKDGWLSSARSGRPRTCADSEGLIPAGVYFFHVDTELNADPYPVVPNFHAWAFPHDDLPSLWHESAQIAAAIEPRTTTETCRLTNKRLACENAHIIPVAEKSWFADNEMDRYGELGGRTGRDVADSPANSIRLRRDVHLLWDNLFFSIIPKKPQHGDSDGLQWCVHSMVQDEELYEDYHNRPTESLTGRAVEYFYARFAWDLFPKVIGFLQSTQPRRLAVRQSDGVIEVRSFSTKECQDFTRGQGRGRSASPTKRSRGPDGKAYEHTGSAEQGCNLTMKRKRRSASSGQSLGVDSAVSDIDTASDIEDVSASRVAGVENYWTLKGCAVHQELSKTCCSDDGEETRGRKRCRSSQ